MVSRGRRGLVRAERARRDGTPAAPAGAVSQFNVNTADDVDDGVCDATHCSLREAINAANADSDASLVVFGIPGPVPAVIQPSTPLPAVSQPVVIDAAPTCYYPGAFVSLDGSLMQSPAFPYGSVDGLKITGDGVTVRGFSIVNFNGNGVSVFGNDNTFECNAIGVREDGTLAGNALSGIELQGSDNAVGNATDTAQRNVLSGNVFAGVNVYGSFNIVQGNFIGTDNSGFTAKPNLNYGVNVSTGARPVGHTGVTPDRASRAGAPSAPRSRTRAR